jgi:hypothetical protein
MVILQVRFSPSSLTGAKSALPYLIPERMTGIGVALLQRFEAEGLSLGRGYGQLAGTAVGGNEVVDAWSGPTITAVIGEGQTGFCILCRHRWTASRKIWLKPTLGMITAGITPSTKARLSKATLPRLMTRDTRLVKSDGAKV